MAYETYEVQPFKVTRVPVVPVFVVYHDGDEESTVRTKGGWVSFGPTSGTWQIDPRPSAEVMPTVTATAVRLDG